MQITDYHAKYFSYELTKRCPSDSIQKLAATLSDAQVDLNPHQIDAALFAFRSPLSKGAILADEVGLGKTIEAGIVISQKWAERKRKILIIVPSNLRKQWHQELLDKFFLNSTILETRSFNEEINKGNFNPFSQDQIIICSYQFVRSKAIYVKKVAWDLVVIDEAHRLRNVYKPNNKIANAIKDAVIEAPKILLTATPLQNSLLELYGLVSIIDDFTFGDLPSYKSQFVRLSDNGNFDDLKARLKPICQRTLRKQVLEYVKYTNRIPITQEFIPTREEQQLYDLVSAYLQRPNLYALPASQRKLMTMILRKLLASSTYAISVTLEALSTRLENVIVEQKEEAIIESEIIDNYESYDELEDEWEADEDEEEVQERTLLSPEQIQEIKQEMDALKRFKELADSVKKNSKGEVLLTALKRGFEQAKEKGGQEKAIIFTESRRTQMYLKNILDTTEFKGKIVLFNGSNTDPESKVIYLKWLNKHKDTDKITGSKSADLRSALVDYFREEAVIMIATEAAAEGINLQFCSLVVNYDLPWNPQRIEQRIGRCHRYGQKYDVVVVNFLNKNNEADQRVYQLLSEKFKLFDGVFGSSDEVLGRLESGVDFEKRIAEIYQNCRTLEEIQSSFDQLQRDLESQIDSQIRQTREKLLTNFDSEVINKLKVSLNESKAYLSKYEDWIWQITRHFLADYGDFDSESYSFMLRSNPFPEETVFPGPYRIGKNIDNANIYRIGHPLAQRIIDSCKEYTCKPAALTFLYSGKPKITAIEELIGSSGYLQAHLFTINSFETEDYVILTGITDSGKDLDKEQCRYLFSLQADIINNIEFKYEPLNVLQQALEVKQSELLTANEGRNSVFFDQEYEKLDKWAEDMKNSLEYQLKELDVAIKTSKAEARKLLRLDEKVNLRNKIKEMEKRRNELRLKLFQNQDEVEGKKEELLDNIKLRMQRHIELKELFTIQWRLANGQDTKA
jgi:ERCC4-related helicase